MFPSAKDSEVSLLAIVLTDQQLNFVGADRGPLFRARLDGLDLIPLTQGGKHPQNPSATEMTDTANEPEGGSRDRDCWQVVVRETRTRTSRNDLETPEAAAGS